MDVEAVAGELMDRATERGQAVVRTDESTPLDELRASVRRLARERGIRVRTGMTGGVLAVALADAAIWDDSAAVMRVKLAAPAEPNIVG